MVFERCCTHRVNIKCVDCLQTLLSCSWAFTARVFAGTSMYQRKFQNVAVRKSLQRTVSRRCGLFGSTSVRSSTSCTSSGNSASRFLLQLQFIWPTVRERGFARWSEMQHSTPAVMNISVTALVCDAPPLFRWCAKPLLKRIPNKFRVWAGGPARGDVQDVSVHHFLSVGVSFCSYTVTCERLKTDGEQEP